MAYTKDEAITVIRTFLESIRQDLPIERAYLFGSYATGRNRDYSDIDLAIVTPVVNSKTSLKISQEIFHRAMLYNVDLEPICFSPEEFEKEELPIVLDIKREGVEITTSGKGNSLTPTHSRTRSSKSFKASMGRRTSKSKRER
jgi:predicted nucleotidyltransferase